MHKIILEHFRNCGTSRAMMPSYLVASTFHDSGLNSFKAGPLGRVQWGSVNPRHQVGARRGPLGLSDWGLAHQTIIRVELPKYHYRFAVVYHDITNFAEPASVG